MASASTTNSILWFLIMILLSFWVAALCSVLYIFVYTIEACVPSIQTFSGILLLGMQLPHACAKKMLAGDSVSCNG